MENINHLPPQLSPQPQSIPGRPIANAADETKKLVEMTQIPPAPAETGKKVDIKV